MTVTTLLGFAAGLCFLLAALSALLPIPHALPITALGLFCWLATGYPWARPA